MSLLEAVVLLDVMEIISAKNQRPLHLQFGDHTSEDTSTDGHIASEWALLVNVRAIDSLK